ncbi:MAG: outer membrane beta-barrel protein [Verrucomicrobiota bacterium]|nr:outer membrane beta-barrel protein [Verrucomicrobiota bacterium]
MKYFPLSKLGIASLAIALSFAPHRSRAGGEGFNQDISDNKETIDTKSDLGLGKFAAFPFHVSVTVRNGYDDNVNLSSFDERESFFTNGAVNFTYDFGNARTRLSLNTGVSATYYWDNGNNQFNNNSDSFDVNAYFGFSIVHRATPRLTLSAQVNAAYLSRPGFDTFNNNFFVVERRSQNFFQTIDKFSVGYAWTPRFSTVTSYTLGYINYDDVVISQFEDRFEHTFGNEFRFLIQPTTTLVAEYRFGIVDYIENGLRNSTSNFFLGGVDHSFSPRFNLSVRAGVEVREFDHAAAFGASDNNTSPYAEATVNYALAKNTSISFFNRYSQEQPNVPDALSRETYRTSLSLRHAFTARISAGLNFAYQHDAYDQTLAQNAFNEDSFDIQLSARYAINRNFAIDVGYQHTEVTSDANLFREFTRNQIYGGVTFTW